MYKITTKKSVSKSTNTKRKLNQKEVNLVSGGLACVIDLIDIGGHGPTCTCRACRIPGG